VVEWIDKSKRFSFETADQITDERSRLSSKQFSRQLRVFDDLSFVVFDDTNGAVLFDDSYSTLPGEHDVSASVRYSAYTTRMYRAISNQTFLSYAKTNTTLRINVYMPDFNAYFVGTGIVIGKGFAVLDVMAHEWSHGYTTSTSNLIYSYQSGAIDEAMSDMYDPLIAYYAFLN
jgi:hypothetical protein